MTTAGDFKLFVVDATDEQHETNLTLSEVEKISELDAIKLAEKYQPERILTELNPLTGKEEKITVPDCDLRKFYIKEQ